VDAFHDDDAVGGELRLVGLVEALFRLEVEGSHPHGLAVHEAEQVAVEAGEVHGLDVLVVEVAVFVAGVAFVADEVVVGGDQDGLAAVDAQLRDEAFGGGRLSSGRGTRNQYEAYLGSSKVLKF
jgi:hypothetical protein